MILHAVITLFLVSLARPEQIVIISGGTVSEYTAIVTRGANTYTTTTTLDKSFDNIQTIEVDTVYTTVTEYN